MMEKTCCLQRPMAFELPYLKEMSYGPRNIGNNINIRRWYGCVIYRGEFFEQLRVQRYNQNRGFEMRTQWVLTC